MLINYAVTAPHLKLRATVPDNDTADADTIHSPNIRG